MRLRPVATLKMTVLRAMRGFKGTRYSARPQMANIASQIKRNARTERERLENRRYTSTIKTYFRRLEAAVAAGDDATADADHKAARLDDRQGRQARRAAPQHRRAQEVPRGPRPQGRLGGLAPYRR